MNSSSLDVSKPLYPCTNTSSRTATPKQNEGVLEMMRLVHEDGYFGSEPLEESLAVLEDKPTVWVDFLKKNETFKDLK